MLSLSAQGFADRVLNGRSFTARHADVDDGFDLSVQHFHVHRDGAGSADGFAVFGNVQVYPRRHPATPMGLQALLRRNLYELRTQLEKAKKLLERGTQKERKEFLDQLEKIIGTPPSPQAKSSEREDDEDDEPATVTSRLSSVYGDIDSVKRSENLARVFLNGSHSILNHVGSGQDIGLSAMYRWGFAPHFVQTHHLQRAWLSLDGIGGPPARAPLHESAWRYSTELTWQDRRYNQYRGNKPKDFEQFYWAYRWRWMVGLQYTVDNPVDRRQSYFGYIRHRPGQALGSLEWKLFAGRSRRNTTLFGIGLQFHVRDWLFAGKKRQ